MDTRSVFRYLFVTRRWTTIAALLIVYIAFSFTYFMAPLKDASPPTFSDPGLPIPDIAERTQQTPQTCTTVGFPPRLVCEGGKTIRDTLQVKSLLPKLDEGRFVYNRITEMWRDVPETVVFKLNLASEPAPSIPDTLRGERATGETPLTPEMSVELRGTAGLEVTPSGPIRQLVSDLAPTTWQWKVTPKISQDQLLTLTVFIHVDDKGPFTLKTFEDVIQVKVTAWQQTKDAISTINPVWAFVVGAIPVLWGAYAWIRGRKWKPPQKKSDWVPFSERMRSRRNRAKRGNDG